MAKFRALERYRRASSRRSFRWTALLSVVCGLVIWHGAQHRPAAPNRPLPSTSHVTEKSDAGTFRIGSFNIHGGKGIDGTRDLSRTADCLRDLDIVGLYEVRAGLQSNQAASLGDALGMSSLFAATENKWWHDVFGNGLLSKRPLDGVRRIPLTGTQGRRFRNAVLAHFEHDGRRIQLLAAHVDNLADHDRQLDEVFDLFLSLEPPAVLIGDLNTRPNAPAIRELLEQPGIVDAVGPSRGRVDWIITRGLHVVESGCDPNEASDHPLVWAELSLEQNSLMTADESNSAPR